MTDSVKAWLQSFVSGQKFIDKIPSERTLKNYMPNLRKYCNFVHKNPDKLIQLKIQGLQNVATEKEFIAEDTLENFITKSKFKPSMKQTIRNTVISFYKANRRPLIEVQKVDVSETKKRQPKPDDVLELDNAMTCERDKAITWFFNSSPVRIDTLSKMVWKDLQPIDDSEVKYQFVIEAERLKGHGRGKYRGLKHVGFIHNLASQKLENYKKELKKKGYAVTEDSPIFIAYRQQTKFNKKTQEREETTNPIKALRPATIEHLFDDASFKAWHDLDLKRFSPQDFRESFQSAFEHIANENMIAPLMTHKARGTAKSYSDHEISELLEVYKKGLPYLLPITVAKVKADLNQTESELTESKQKYGEQQAQIATMKEEFEKEIQGLKISFNAIMETNAIRHNVEVEKDPIKKEKLWKEYTEKKGMHSTFK